MNATTLDEARAAKARAMEVFGKLADVVGVGITRTDGGYALKVNLRTKPEGGTILPQSLERVPVVIEVVGTIRKRHPRAARDA